MTKKSVLVVEDEEDILELLRYNLNEQGFLVTCASSGEEALDILKTKLPDLILLDLMLPGIDGLDICKQLKAEKSTALIPIVILSAKGEESDIVVGLELGADDYITKPFSPKILISRIKTALRRKGGGSADVSTINKDDLIIDKNRHEVLVKGKPISLTLTEFRILFFLAGRPGLVFTRYQIVDAIQGEDYTVTDRSVDAHIVGLRKKLGICSKYIETVRGIGYRFKE